MGAVMSVPFPLIRVLRESTCYPFTECAQYRFDQFFSSQPCNMGSTSQGWANTRYFLNSRRPAEFLDPTVEGQNETQTTAWFGQVFTWTLVLALPKLLPSACRRPVPLFRVLHRAVLSATVRKTLLPTGFFHSVYLARTSVGSMLAFISSNFFLTFWTFQYFFYHFFSSTAFFCAFYRK